MSLIRLSPPPSPPLSMPSAVAHRPCRARAGLAPAPSLLQSSCRDAVPPALCAPQPKKRRCAARGSDPVDEPAAPTSPARKPNPAPTWPLPRMRHCTCRHPPHAPLAARPTCLSQPYHGPPQCRSCASHPQPCRARLRAAPPFSTPASYPSRRFTAPGGNPGARAASLQPGGSPRPVSRLAALRRPQASARAEPELRPASPAVPRASSRHATAPHPPATLKPAKDAPSSHAGIRRV